MSQAIATHPRGQPSTPTTRISSPFAKPTPDRNRNYLAREARNRIWYTRFGVSKLNTWPARTSGVSEELFNAVPELWAGTSRRGQVLCQLRGAEAAGDDACPI